MLVGVGIGPGDPELLTVKAVRLILEAEVVYVPGRVAAGIIAPYRTDVEVLSFPMTGDEAEIARCMEKNADTVAGPAAKGLCVFCILGDPNFYGTFGRLSAVLADRHPAVRCATVPGISAITAFASVADVPVSGGVGVSDGSEEESRLLLKVTHPKETAARLRAEGFTDFVLVERMYMDGEQVYRGGELPEKSSYFSVLFARR